MAEVREGMIGGQTLLEGACWRGFKYLYQILDVGDVKTKHFSNRYPDNFGSHIVRFSKFQTALYLSNSIKQALYHDHICWVSSFYIKNIAMKFSNFFQVKSTGMFFRVRLIKCPSIYFAVLKGHIVFMISKIDLTLFDVTQ